MRELEPRWRVAALAVLAVFVYLSLALLEVSSEVGARVLAGLAVLHVALAAFAWTRGRGALFAAIVPVFLGPAVFLTAELAPTACAIRPFGPEVASREGEYRPLPPHYVCRVTLADGTRVVDGGTPSEFFIVLAWGMLATAVALTRRLGRGVRAAIVCATWLAAMFLASA